MGAIKVSKLGKAYKRYTSQWARLAEWLAPPFLAGRRRHELKWVLQDIDIDIKAGESVGLIGINGAGKSTLLKLITGTAQPTVGSVTTQGRIAALLELGMGFHPDFTGRQNVLMSGQLIGMSASEITALMPEIEAFAEIGEYIDQPVRVYSSGMQVRLAFSVATAVRPDILIVDEALAVGDVFFQQKCYERIRGFCEAGTTLLFVSHAMGTVYSLCDRAILLSEGRVALDASPREVIDLYNAQLLQRQGKGSAKVTVIDSDKEGNVGSFSSDGAAIGSVELLMDGHPASAVVSESLVTVRIRVRFEQTYRDPHIGFQIRNARGEAAFMTNTYCMNRSIGAVAQGEEIVAEFSFKIGLAEGEYTITSGVAEGGAGEGEFNQTLARSQDAKAFTIVRNMDAILWSGFYNLDPTCTLHRRQQEQSVS
ncbi:MAG TPA: ABC transporter ATP-binding protein [Burkholderiaceae bacterium]